MFRQRGPTPASSRTPEVPRWGARRYHSPSVDAQRIMVVGSGGAGKTTLSRALGEALGLPVVHLDAEYWRPGWQVTPDDEWRDRVRALAAGDRWILDGNFGGTADLRVGRAQLAIFLDLPRLTCLASAVKRYWRYRGSSRPDMTPGCDEKLDWSYLRWIWTYPRSGGRRMLARLEQNPELEVVRLASRAAVGRFLRDAGTRG